jgi:hypothetical protein
MRTTLSTEAPSNLRYLKLSRSQIIAIGVPSLLAIIAAFLKVVIGLGSHKGWNWIGFFQDVVQLGFIAAIVTGASAAIIRWDVDRTHAALVMRTLRLVLIAFYGQLAEPFEISSSFTPADALNLLKKTQDDLLTVNKGVLDFVQRFTERPDLRLRSAIPELDASFAQLSESVDELLTGWQGIIWTELSRLIKTYEPGLRYQRAMLFSYIISDLGQISSTSGASLAKLAIVARDRAALYGMLVKRTDAAIEADLVLRSSSSAAAAKDDAAIFSTYPVDLSALSCTSDRVAYLLAYCDTAMKDATRADQVRALVDPLKLSLLAVSSEISEATQLARALSDLTEEAIAQTRARWLPRN